MVLSQYLLIYNVVICIKKKVEALEIGLGTYGLKICKPPRR